MDRLALQVDGLAVASEFEPLRTAAGILVPLDAFTVAIDAEAKEAGLDGSVALCRGDRCVPIDVDSLEEIGGCVYTLLERIGEALGLHWTVEGKELRVDTKEAQDSEEIGVGRKAPGFTLPDMFTGEPVSTESFLRRKTVFYMWASW